MSWIRLSSPQEKSFIYFIINNLLRRNILIIPPHISISFLLKHFPCIGEVKFKAFTPEFKSAMLPSIYLSSPLENYPLITSLALPPTNYSHLCGVPWPAWPPASSSSPCSACFGTKPESPGGTGPSSPPTAPSWGHRDACCSGSSFCNRARDSLASTGSISSITDYGGI